MPSDNLTKEAIRSPGNFLADWFTKNYKDKPIRSLFGEERPQDASLAAALARMRDIARAKVMAVHPGATLDSLKHKINNTVRAMDYSYSPNPQGTQLGHAIDWDRDNTRKWQAEALKALVDNLLIPGAVAGTGLGLLRQAPKLHKTYKDLKSIPDTDEDEGSVKKAEGPTPPNEGGLWNDITSSIGKGIFGRGVATSVASAPMPFQGAMLPLGIGAVAAGAIGGDKLLDIITDKLRARALRKRKDKLRRQFYGSIMGKTASADDMAITIIDTIYDTLTTKSANDATALIPGYTSLMAALLGTGALAAGYGISKSKDPLKAKAEALKLVLAKERLKNRYPAVPVSTRGTTISDIMRDVDKDTYSMPLIVPNRTASDEDEAVNTIKYPDLSELYALSKSSGARWDSFKSKAMAPVRKVMAPVRKITTSVNDIRDEIQSARADAARLHGFMGNVDKFKAGWGESWDKIKGMIPSLIGNLASGASGIGSAAVPAPVYTPAPDKSTAVPQAVPSLGPATKAAPVAPMAPAADNIAAQREDLSRVREQANSAGQQVALKPLK